MIKQHWTGEPTWQNDFDYQSVAPDLTGAVVQGRLAGKITQSYLVDYDHLSLNIINTSPKMLEVVGYKQLNMMYIMSYSIKHEGGKVYRVTVNREFPPAETPEEDQGDTGESPTPEESQRREGISVQTSTSISYEPILSCYKLRKPTGESKINLADAVFISLYVQNAITKRANGKYAMAYESQDYEGYIKEPTDCPIWKYIAAGYRTVPTPSTTITFSYISDSPRIAKLTNVGKITQIQNGKDNHEGYLIDYLMSEFRVTRTGRRKYRIEESYLQSQPGGFNKQLYKK